MSGTTSVPPITIVPEGPLLPAESEIVTGLGADWNAAMGGDLNLDPRTPQGQIIASTAAMLGDNNDQWLFFFNGVDPALNEGRMQDGIARIYFLDRLPALPSILEVLCGGLSRVVIPANSLIKDSAGLIWYSLGSATIGVNGTITQAFAAQDTGPVAIPASIEIYQSIPNWDTVSVVSGTVGRAVETPTAFEQRRQATVAANSNGMLASIRGSVLKVADVTDAYVTENSTASPVTTGGVTLAAHSVYVCVVGGSNADVAKAIFLKKPPGCGYTGTTTVTVSDDNAGYQTPYPTYDVTFQIAIAAPITFNVILAATTQAPANAQTLVQAAIADAFAGGDGGPIASIGFPIYASRFYSAIAKLGPWVRIIEIEIGTSKIPDVTFTGAISGTALSVSGVTGTLAIGQFIYGTGVAPGTRIVSGSGASWVVAVSQTVASEAMVSATPNKDSLAIQINWVPTLQPFDINLTFV